MLGSHLADCPHLSLSCLLYMCAQAGHELTKKVTYAAHQARLPSLATTQCVDSTNLSRINLTMHCAMPCRML